MQMLGQLRNFSQSQEDVIKEGDIVLIGDTNSKRIYWPLAKVMKLIPGRDGRVRVVEVATGGGSFLRPKTVPIGRASMSPLVPPHCDATATQLAAAEGEVFPLRTSLWLTVTLAKQHEGYFATDLVILNLGQMTRSTPELAPPPLQTPAPHQRRTFGHYV
ncbi:hypothetical protein AVEN_181489-1 [Araneus ventricosus]|uniref:DUF5641 domain-containing protein n=1 Tax=Araneus ventricosus TaxID=182803 RepID=A0A4Y2F2P7_ARAVE|nr:hypothetical protein AVEN_181489-1 [Araneus ventricosus]